MMMKLLEERFEKVDRIQGETIKDVTSKLKKHSRCLLVRPTGFGKTKIAVDIARTYKNVVFIYPFINIGLDIKKNDMGDINTLLFTYAKLRSMFKCKEEFRKTFSKLNRKNTIFVIDEAHFIGAPQTRKVIESLINDICPKANYLGLTATPNRTDKFEIKWHFFNGISAYEYTVVDAIRDGILTKPYYVYTPLEPTELEGEYKRRIDSTPGFSNDEKTRLKMQVKKLINPERLNIGNLDGVITKNLCKFINDQNYYKFIAFFSTFNNLHTKQDELVSAFKNIFPYCEINVIIVTSESLVFRNNLKQIHNLKPRPNTIDLILNINMITFGFHVPDLTGVFMFRSTISNIIYAQQVGRALSITQIKPAIIFDFVENLKKRSPDSVIQFDNPIGENTLNKIDLIYPEDTIELDQKTTDLLKIDRLINNIIKEQFESEVVRNYRLGRVSINYCLTKLQLCNKSDFVKVLERYTE